MPENQRLHIAVQFLTVALVIFAVHGEKERFDETLLGLSDSRSILPEPRSKSLECRPYLARAKIRPEKKRPAPMGAGRNKTTTV